MKVVPEKSYTYTVEYNEVLNRWYAKFTHTKTEIQYEFPLVDTCPYEPNRCEAGTRPYITHQEEVILALVFSQMVSVIQSARAREAAMVRAMQAQSAPKAAQGATEGVLTS